ncbi:MAG: hypothetical protein CML66_10845 [Rhodobacteraceae bacterium]|nr:hypothetical protein [Paracoccaceae bacterium]QEW19475.1 HTH-type transcriptional repressor YvoA [Marinibacterium anthonyi]
MQNDDSGLILGSDIDRSLGIPVRQQIRAALVHRISTGALTAGAPLPSVRDLAEQTGVAPMTVTKIYADLKDSGLVEARVGAGTFVADCALTRFAASGEIDALLTQVDAVIDRAAASGLPPADIAAMLAARAIRRASGLRRPRFLMVGLFDAATRSYAARVSEQVGDRAQITPMVLTAQPTEDEIALMRSADLIATFYSQHDRIARLAPDTPVVSLRFIPAESTRLALASLDPLARVAVVSRFAYFLPALELGVRRFAPHVANVSAMDLDAPDLAQAVSRADVLVLSTGAEAAAEFARPDAVQIEYRHIPDPGDVARLVLPHLTPQAEALNETVPAEGGRKEA